MTKKRLVYVSCAFKDERYIEQQDRLKESILKIDPSANIVFNRDSIPANSLQMDDSLYGFKVHAINNVWDDYEYVVWLDPAMVQVDEIDPLLSITNNNGGVYAVKDDNKLSNCISDIALKYFDSTREELDRDNQHLIGGSLYIFNTNNINAEMVFRAWYKAEFNGIFGTQAQAQSERINGHRNDETCLAMCMYQHNIKPIEYEVSRYNEAVNPIFIKKHFK